MKDTSSVPGDTSLLIFYLYFCTVKYWRKRKNWVIEQIRRNQLRDTRVACLSLVKRSFVSDSPVPITH